jgi:hypothetical protein
MRLCGMTDLTEVLGNAACHLYLTDVDALD